MYNRVGVAAVCVKCRNLTHAAARLHIRSHRKLFYISIFKNCFYISHLLVELHIIEMHGIFVKIRTTYFYLYHVSVLRSERSLNILVNLFRC